MGASGTPPTLVDQTSHLHARPALGSNEAIEGGALLHKTHDPTRPARVGPEPGSTDNDHSSHDSRSAIEVPSGITFARLDRIDELVDSYGHIQ